MSGAQSWVVRFARLRWSDDCDFRDCSYEVNDLFLRSHLQVVLRASAESFKDDLCVVVSQAFRPWTARRHVDVSRTRGCTRWRASGHGGHLFWVEVQPLSALGPEARVRVMHMPVLMHTTDDFWRRLQGAASAAFPEICDLRKAFEAEPGQGWLLEAADGSCGASAGAADGPADEAGAAEPPGPAVSARKHGRRATYNHLPAKFTVEDWFMETAAQSPALAVTCGCPISLEPIVDPVCTATGSVYDREPLLRWFATKSPPTDPATNQVLPAAEWWRVPVDLFEAHVREGTVTAALRGILVETVVVSKDPPT
jgi:hypothetical protein